MDCPGCGAPTTVVTLDGRQQARVDVDLCASCQALWFDHLESLQLSPGAVLKLFGIIAEHQAADRPFPRPLRCPRCGLPLLLTHDLQRQTTFEYWRCDREHGRFITFLQFLREKNFITAPSSDELKALRDGMGTINCTSCGAPIDLGRGAVCSHCGSVLSMIDLKQIQETADRLLRAQQGNAATSETDRPPGE